MTQILHFPLKSLTCLRLDHLWIAQMSALMSIFNSGFLDVALSVDNADELFPSCPNLLDLSASRAGADTDYDT